MKNVSALPPTVLRLAALCLSVAWISGDTFAADAGGRKPNILLIVADDLGYADIGANGCKDIPTPNIDSLASHGVRFTSGYVSGPYCSPTRAGLMTGRYQTRFGHEFNPGPAENAVADFGLPLTETTLPQRLKGAGYATGMVGKWHLGYKPPFHPQARGFDEFFGFLGGAHSYIDNEDRANPVIRGTEPVPSVTYTTDMFGDEAVKYISKQTDDRPWFLYLAFNAVHTPMHATENRLARFSDLKDPTRRKLAAMHVAMDENIGKVLATLRDRKLEEDTLIFFVSDNGGPTPTNGSRNDPLRGFKAQTWEGGVRVPLVIQWKGTLPAGKVVDDPVIQLDFLPTALAAAGVVAKPEWKLDGVDLIPYLKGEKSEPPHKALFWRFGTQIAVRMGDWKLVKAPGEGIGRGEIQGKATTEGAHLYNLASDIGEKTNLADKEPGKYRELAAAWDTWNAGLVPAKWFPNRQAPAAKKQAARKKAAR
jgi:arylsulfatase A-like enzyme